jgi:hypothetical protein
VKIKYVEKAILRQFSSDGRPVQSAVLPALPAQPQMSQLSLPVSAMREVHDFIAALERVGKSQKDIKPLVDAAWGDNAFSISQINCIVKAVKEGKNTSDQRHSSAKKTGDVVVSIAAAIENDQRVTIPELASMASLLGPSMPS